MTKLGDWLDVGREGMEGVEKAAKILVGVTGDHGAPFKAREGWRREEKVRLGGEERRKRRRWEERDKGGRADFLIRGWGERILRTEVGASSPCPWANFPALQRSCQA